MVSWEEAREVIIVRDRREPKQFSIHNRLIDEWSPIIGDRGLILYTLYVRLANRVDERAFPGYTLIQRHFGYGRTTISLYNQLLVWCRLVYINSGGQDRPNEYYILEVPEVNADALDRIRRRASTELDLSVEYKQRFHDMLMQRVDDWHPIQHWWWRSGRKGVTTVTRAQLELELVGLDGDVDDSGETVDKSGEVVPPEDHPSPAAGLPQSAQGTTPVHSEDQASPAGGLEQSEVTIKTEQPEKNNQQQQDVVVGILSVLNNFGVSSTSKVLELAARYSVGEVERMVSAAGKADVRNPQGLLVSWMEKGHVPAAGVDEADFRRYSRDRYLGGEEGSDA